MVDRMPEELWMQVHNTVQEAVTKTIPKKKKWLSEKALQIAEERREKYTQLNGEFQRTARRDKKALLNEQCQEIEENNRMKHGEGDGSPLQYSCLGNPMDGGA